MSTDAFICKLKVVSTSEAPFFHVLESIPALTGLSHTQTKQNPGDGHSSASLLLQPQSNRSLQSTQHTTHHKKRSSSYCFLLDITAISFIVQLSEHSTSIEESWDHTLPPQGHSQPEGAQTHILHLPCRPPLPPASEMHTVFLFSHWIISLARNEFKLIRAQRGSGRSSAL